MPTAEVGGSDCRLLHRAVNSSSRFAYGIDDQLAHVRQRSPRTLTPCRFRSQFGFEFTSGCVDLSRFPPPRQRVLTGPVR